MSNPSRFRTAAVRPSMARASEIPVRTITVWDVNNEHEFEQSIARLKRTEQQELEQRFAHRLQEHTNSTANYAEVLDVVEYETEPQRVFAVAKPPFQGAVATQRASASVFQIPELLTDDFVLPDPTETVSVGAK